MTALLTERISLQDRALILRAIGTEWEHLIDSFEAKNDVPDFITEHFLLNATHPYAHPSLDAEGVIAGMVELRDALRDLNRFESGDGLPESMWETHYAGYDQGAVMHTLNSSVDDCLWTLLHGSAFPCRECRRVNANVWTWAAPLPGTNRCARDAR